LVNIHQTIWRHIQEDSNFYSHHCDYFKFEHRFRFIYTNKGETCNKNRCKHKYLSPLVTFNNHIQFSFVYRQINLTFIWDVICPQLTN
jgi:hypothetical protein